MGRKVRIESDDVLIIRTAPIFQPLLAPARYKGSGSTKARDVPPPMPRIVRPGGRQHRLELATQRQTAKLTLSQLINRLLPQRAPVRHRRSNRRRLVRPNNQITRALAPPSLPRPPSPTPHDLTPNSAPLAQASSADKPPAPAPSPQSTPPVTVCAKSPPLSDTDHPQAAETAVHKTAPPHTTQSLPTHAHR